MVRFGSLYGALVESNHSEAVNNVEDCDEKEEEKSFRLYFDE